jgi:hypothetical protein
MAVVHAEDESVDPGLQKPARPRKTNRGSLPRHLPRIEEVTEPEDTSSVCGGERHVIGEDVPERLDIVPAQFRVIHCPAVHVCMHVRGDPPSEIRLSVLYKRGGASCGTGAADPRRSGLVAV